jgi:hypothetical protein
MEEIPLGVAYLALNQTSGNPALKGADPDIPILIAAKAEYAKLQ